MAVLQVTLVALSFALSAAAQRRGRGSRAARLAAGAIAGIVVGKQPTSRASLAFPLNTALGCVIFVILLCLCCALLFRRRRARGQGVPIGPGAPGRSGLFGRFGGGRGAQEAGYGPGPQGGWNAGGQPAHGGHYQPPQGPPPGAPQPGGFAPPPAAHTRPY
ncbi:hypothetical protein BD413DRAFT_571377 [Trametes elegans]|nr:hypothetical protein BD413DRAFT_571377 [Trametes elegans]